jgi:hypothetical protein
MKPPESCEHCHAELPSLDEPCPRCGGLPHVLAEALWRQRLTEMRTVCWRVMAGTAAGAGLLLFLNWRAGLGVLALVAVVQVPAYRYYVNRLAHRHAWLPGPVTVEPDARLQTRIDGDLWAMALAIIPLIGALSLLVQALLGRM